MNYLYLILVIFLSSSTTIFGKFYNNKIKEYDNPIHLYNLLFILSTFLVWSLLYCLDYSFNPKVLIYSLLFSFFFTISNIGIIYALKNGPASLTILFLNLSLILTSIWGIIFWNVSIKTIMIIGLIISACSMFLCIYDKSENNRVNSKWLVFALLALFGNAGCAIVQRTQQMVFNGEHGKMLMFFATMLSSVIFLIIFFISKKGDAKELLKRFSYLPISSGILNTFNNLLVIILATSTLSPSLIYPTIGVGGLLFVLLFSFFIFKERIRIQQLIGIIFGIIGTLLLSL